MTRENEVKLLEDCLCHNRCDKLIRQYYKTVSSAVKKTFFVYHISFTQEDAEDLLQDTFVRLFDNDRRLLRQYDPKRGLSLTGWIKMITVQTVIISVRGKKPKIVPIEDHNIPVEIDLDGMIFSKEEVAYMLEKCLKTISYLERLVFGLHFLDELSLSDIASFLHKTENNIYQIKHRSLSRVKECMEKWKNEKKK
jgi:RNA polymerase sigma factor (sigma-70 family)